MKRNLTLYIRDILENMRDAEGFIHGMSFEQFATDKKTLNAVTRSVEVIGEATKHVPESLRSKCPAVPWKEMAGIRDKVIDFCFRVDREAVWLVVKERIPVIKPLIEKILQELEQSGDTTATS